MNSLSFNKIQENIIDARQTDEKNLRKQLAYLYRIFEYYGWCDLIVTHLSVRIPSENALLILPFGLSFDEVTPENLVKVDFDGNIIESPCNFNINQNGTTVHRGIYRNMPHIHAVLHTHSEYGVAVANLEDELLLLDQIAMMFYGKIGYHDFETLFINNNEQEQLLHDMQGKSAMILKNHGLLTVGQSIAEAFWFHYYLESSCKRHVLTQSIGGKIKYPHPDTVKHTADKYEQWRNKNEHMAVSDSELLFDAAKRKVGYLFD
ncbi:MAG: class aldolase [Gammaproteobacteria bacterium]|jgi:ribulose-5-phosphate 4-epimerase/fuculose-1-phosphate aldolase|nr:class aldolase [Gammaproteobacteria bacterium]